MKFTSILTLIAFGLAERAAAANCPARPATTAEQKVLFDQFINSFYVKKNVTEAMLNHVHENYIQHNQNVPSGRQNAIDRLKNYIPTMKATIVKTSVSDSTGWVLVKQDIVGKPYNAVVDIFRFDGTCIVEHWDVIDSKKANATNPLALFDGQNLG
jgi:predicted SnoaL-like aldol condensation-catalyzing enzyme